MAAAASWRGQEWFWSAEGRLMRLGFRGFHLKPLVYELRPSDPTKTRVLASPGILPSRHPSPCRPNDPRPPTPQPFSHPALPPRALPSSREIQKPGQSVNAPVPQDIRQLPTQGTDNKKEYLLSPLWGFNERLTGALRQSLTKGIRGIRPTKCKPQGTQET